MLNEKYVEVLKKKALGYYYDEEQVESERLRKTDFLFCKTNNRLYHGVGFIKLKNVKLTSSAVSFDEPKKYRVCSNLGWKNYLFRRL